MQTSVFLLLFAVLHLIAAVRQVAPAALSPLPVDYADIPDISNLGLSPLLNSEVRIQPFQSAVSTTRRPKASLRSYHIPVITKAKHLNDPHALDEDYLDSPIDFTTTTSTTSSTTTTTMAPTSHPTTSSSATPIARSQTLFVVTDIPIRPTTRSIAPVKRVVPVVQSYIDHRKIDVKSLPSKHAEFVPFDPPLDILQNLSASNQHPVLKTVLRPRIVKGINGAPDRLEYAPYRYVTYSSSSSASKSGAKRLKILPPIAVIPSPTNQVEVAVRSRH